MPDLSSKLPHGIRRLFRLPLTRGRMLREAEDEIQFHLDMRVAEFKALGMSEEDAAREAHRRFGDAGEFRSDLARRAERRARRFTVLQWFQESAQDTRIALRQFLRTPALGIMVVLTLAVCIGATTAVYGVVRHLLLAPLPYPDGNRIVSVETRSAGDGNIPWGISAELFRTWAARSRTLEDFAAFQWGDHALGDAAAQGQVPDSVGGALATPSFLSLLRIRPSLGRGFTTADARRGAPPVVLLGDSLWRSRFDASPAVIGGFVKVDGVSRTIIGVLPPGVGSPLPDGGAPPSVVLPLNLDSMPGANAFARQRPGVTSASASRELGAILRTFPDTGSLYGARAQVRTAAERVEPGQRRGVEVLFAAAAGLLLIACADVAGLLLMRGWARRREFAIRQALGAGQGRLTRQLLSESLLLAIPGGALGLLVAWLGLRIMHSVLPDFIAAVSLDGAAFVWTLTISVATAVLFGVGPALLSWERSLDAALRAGGARVGQDRGFVRAHAALVVAQVALSLVFLTTAGVLTRSFVVLLRAPVGYEREGLYEVRVRRTSVPSQNSKHAEDVARMQLLRDALAATPGVNEVAVGPLPLGHVRPAPSAIEGRSGVRPSGIVATGGMEVSPEYFKVARIPLLRGRGFDPSPATAAGEVIVNPLLARRLWPDGDPIGARMRYGDEIPSRWLTVVGIAGDVRMPGDAGPDFFGLQVYRSPGFMDGTDGALLIRSRSAPSDLQPLLARAIARAGVGVKFFGVEKAGMPLEYAYRTPRFAVAVFGAFTLVAVLLAAVGLFGILAHAVARRNREIGIRIALGADPIRLTRSILRQTLQLVVVGCLFGLATTFAASRMLTTLVFGVRPVDPAALGAALVVLLVIGLTASVIPVRRALGVDPMDTLRAE